MKISVTQENLARVLNYILKATAVKPNIPVLANVLISTEKGKIKFSATDLEIAITAWIGGEIGEEGALTVNARLLTEFVSQLKSSKVDLFQTGQTLEIITADNQAQLNIIPAEDFPTIPDIEGEANLVVNANEFRDTIFKTSFAAASDQSRPILTGLLLESTQRKASLVGVDGFRLSKRIMKLEKGPAEDLSIVIPAKSALELARIISDTADENDTINIFLLKDKNQILFKVNEVVLSSRLLDGDFPDYKKIIPTEKNLSLTITKSELSASVKIASIFARNVIGNKTVFSIDSEEKKLTLAAKVQDLGNNESKAAIKEIDGEDYETAYNAKFLSDMLGSIVGEDIYFETNGITAPGVFKDSSDESYTHIIMPMRLE